MAKLPNVRVPRLITASAVHAVRAAVNDAVRLGILWRLRPGTVGGSLPAQPESVPVRLDGDSSTIYARSMVGSVMPSQRVWCVQIPPAGVYVLGIIGVSRSAATTELVTASGDYVQPRGLTFIRGVASGGGGAGGGAATTAAGQSSVGGGGGGGCAVEFLLAADDFAHTTTVTVGAGGGGVAGGNGNSGGTTSFGGLFTANGGSGGAFRNAAAVDFGVDGGNGGATIGGTLTGVIHGGSGGAAGWGAANGLGISGVGGSAHLGGGAAPRRTNSAGQALAGFAGRLYGGGGSGACNSGGVAATAGGAGAAGVVMVQEFYS
jgi:hypothetical protein